MVARYILYARDYWEQPSCHGSASFTFGQSNDYSQTLHRPMGQHSTTNDLTFINKTNKMLVTPTAWLTFKIWGKQINPHITDHCSTTTTGTFPEQNADNNQKSVLNLKTLRTNFICLYCFIVSLWTWTLYIFLLYFLHLLRTTVSILNSTLDRLSLYGSACDFDFNIWNVWVSLLPYDLSYDVFFFFVKSIHLMSIFPYP